MYYTFPCVQHCGQLVEWQRIKTHRRCCKKTKQKKYTCITPQHKRTIWGVTSGEITSSHRQRKPQERLQRQTDRWPCKDSHFLFFNRLTSFSEACGRGRPDIVNCTPHPSPKFPPDRSWNPLWISHNQTSICPPYPAEASICLIDLWRLLPCGRDCNIVIP